MKVAVVFGTRPEAIKMAPVIRALSDSPLIDPIVVTSGQHSDMVREVLDIFDIAADIDLDVMEPNQTLTHVTTSILRGLETVFGSIEPDWVLVHGDTATTFAAALAAFYARIPVGHVEAGLRTRNLASPWPEEANRSLTSSITTLHFAPTNHARDNLTAESVEAKTIIVTGNTVVDALLLASEQTTRPDLASVLDKRYDTLESSRKLVLATGHRRENLDGGIRSVCLALAKLARRDDVEILFAVHPNPAVQSVVAEVLGDIDNVQLIRPLPYLDFVYLMNRSHILVTDSGGIQEEAPSLGVPVLVTRDTTERPEATDAGTVRLVGTDSDHIVAEASRLLNDPTEHAAMASRANPYGDGKAAQRITSALEGFSS